MPAKSKMSGWLLAPIKAWLRRCGMVLYSTPASVRAGWPSVFAFVEVAVAVAGYWWFAIHFETQKHLWISVCVAPLSLLQSKKSVGQDSSYSRSPYR